MKTTKVKTDIGTLEVQQEGNAIKLKLISSCAHPGTAKISVLNASNGDTATLLWIK